MALLKKLFYIMFILVIVKQALGGKILYSFSKSIGLQDSFTRPIFQNLDLFFVLGCAILSFRFFNKFFQGGRK